MFPFDWNSESLDGLSKHDHWVNALQQTGGEWIIGRVFTHTKILASTLTQNSPSDPCALLLLKRFLDCIYSL